MYDLVTFNFQSLCATVETLRTDYREISHTTPTYNTS